ncbi:MAG: alpha/beta hydrolase [Proteobacteria bacterium]|nr:alpha/beta hydrolase [Pseudomonadota bacterium]
MELSVRGKPVFAATGGRVFDPALPAVVFVHGAGMDHTVWSMQTRFFAHHGHSVLAIDLPGHGRSAGPALESIEAQGAWVLDLIAAAGTGRTALVGHSMGSLAVLDASRQGPDRTERLALLGAAERMPVHPALLAAAERNEPTAWDMITGWGFGRSAQLGGHRGPGLWMTGGGRRLLARAPDGVLHADLAACNAYEDAVLAADTVACPTLLICGRDDRMTPVKGAAALCEAFADGRMTILEGAGHMMMIERPDETLDALKDFLGG